VTHAEAVIDASVLAAAFFNETRSEEARNWLRQGPRLVAPDLLRIEIASIAAKKIWKAEASQEAGSRALLAIDDFVDRLEPARTLIIRALHLAAEHRFSAYDATYLALAESEGITVVTFDEKLIARAAEAGMSKLATGLPL
jgi:predicted nucleic acid-binding protein